MIPLPHILHIKILELTKILQIEHYVMVLNNMVTLLKHVYKNVQLINILLYKMVMVKQDGVHVIMMLVM